MNNTQLALERLKINPKFKHIDFEVRYSDEDDFSDGYTDGTWMSELCKVCGNIIHYILPNKIECKVCDRCEKIGKIIE